jgi:hypothetical protein
MGEIASLLVGLALFGNMLLSVYTVWATRRTHNAIGELEKNTNSIKDALIATTAKASFAEGVKQQKDFPS